MSLNHTEEDRKWMELAVGLGKKSRQESAYKPYVGVVIVKDGVLLGESYRGEKETGNHAEYGLIKELTEKGVDLTGSTVYSTLEPCSTRNHPKTPCATHLIHAGVSTVFIGIFDPNPNIFRAGWTMLNESGITLKDFTKDLRSDIRNDNREFIDQFKKADGPIGSANFDWTQGDGKFQITEGNEVLEFEVGSRGRTSVYIYGTGPKGTCLLRGAHDLEANIDDPGSMMESARARVSALEVNDIVVVEYENVYLLIKATKVENMDQGGTCYNFAFDFKVIPKSYFEVGTSPAIGCNFS
jgi:diaminohydroxyphosphoribosylaminopyrimidine deaminase/5-amino-6-(5-phosphoribosylamino)uracil reductase